MFSLIRLAIILLTRRWGWIVVGIACILTGIIIGLLSHTVSYQRVGPTQVIHYLRDNSNSDAYVQLANSATLYIMHQSDFSPSLSGISFNDQSMVSIVYQSDTTTHIDVTSTSGAVLNGDAYTIIEMTDNDTHTSYTTDTYNQNPTGYYENDWGGGIALFLLGIVMTGLAWFWPRIRAKRGKGVATNAIAGTYPAYPNQPNQPVQPTPYYPGYNQQMAYPTPPVQPSDPYASAYGGPAPYPPVPQQPYPPYQQNQPYQQYPPYQPGQPVQQPQNPYSQHGQANNPYPSYQQPQE